MITVKSVAKVADATSLIQGAATALRQAVDEAGIDASQLGAIINSSVGRDLNIWEPAIAALIQQQAGIHLRFDPRSPARPPITFDLLDGVSSVASASSVIESFCLAGDVEFAAIIAGDVHPSMSPFLRPSFPFLTDVFVAIVSTDGPGLATITRLDGGRCSERRTELEPEAFADLTGVGSAGRSEITMRAPVFDVPYLVDMAHHLTLMNTDTAIVPWPGYLNEKFESVAGTDLTLVNLYPHGRTHYTAMPLAALHALVNGLASDVEQVAVAPLPGENQVFFDVVLASK